MTINMTMNTSTTNRTIEGFFNQIKHYLKLNKKVCAFSKLKAIGHKVPY
jgi:hypothetical protein